MMATSVARTLVYVPLIGFRPAGTRVLRERAETTANGTKLMVLAVAATPDRTDVVVEWERTGDPATCPPDSQLLVHTNMAPLEKGLTAELVIGLSRHDAVSMRRRAMQVSHPSIGAIDALIFPPLQDSAEAGELHGREGPNEWRVPFSLAPGHSNASALAVEVVREGVAVRAQALARYGAEVIIELGIEAPHQIRQVGTPIPTPSRFSSTRDDDHRARTQEHRRVFGEPSRPIRLEDDRGNRTDEVGRLFTHEPQQMATGRPFISRFLVAFAAPSVAAKKATLVVPFVELNDLGPSTSADLRGVPLDRQLGKHRFRIVATEQHGADQRKVVLEIPASTQRPRFVQPARMEGSDPAFAWERHALDAPPPGHDAIWMATKVGDPPIVTFTGAVLRVDGPLLLELPLA
jgi:hypothetical protein